MTKETGLSLHDALLWEKCKVASATEFVAALHLSQAISEKQALTQLCELMACGLPVYDKSKQYTFDKNDERWPDYQGLIVATVLAKRDGIQVDEIEGKPLPDFKNLLIIRHEAFEIFKKRHVMEPYPWPYPLEWLEEDEDEDEDEDEAGEQIMQNQHKASEANEKTIIRHGMANNREVGSAKKLIGAILMLYYGQDILDKDNEIIADELINDFASKGIPEPLERRALTKWIQKAKDAINKNSK